MLVNKPIVQYLIMNYTSRKKSCFMSVHSFHLPIMIQHKFNANVTLEMILLALFFKKKILLFIPVWSNRIFFMFFSLFNRFKYFPEHVIKYDKYEPIRNWGNNNPPVFFLKMTLVTRDDIEPFPPLLHRNVVYVRSAEHLKPFILSKLINAEYAAYSCRTFSLLQERTRCAYLKTLCENLTEKSYDLLCDEQKRSSQRRLSLLSNASKKRYFSNMKKMFSRSNSSSDGPQTSVKSDGMNNDKVGEWWWSSANIKCEKM